jgi:hypothetical protein
MNKNKTDACVIGRSPRDLSGDAIGYMNFVTVADGWPATAQLQPASVVAAASWRALLALGSCSAPVWRPLPARAGGLHRPQT